MLLKLKFEDITANSARGEVDGKKVNFFMRVRVNESNIVQAIEKLRDNKSVVCFDYVGDINFLKTIDLGNKPVVVDRVVETLDMNIDFMMNELDTRVRINLIVPKDFKDMKAVYTYCQKYPNIRISGGKLLRLNGCNIGAVGKEDIPKKVPDSRIPLVVETEYCVFRNIDIEEADEVEFYDIKKVSKEKRVRTEKPKTKSKPKPKKQLSSLLSLVSTGDVDNF